MASTSPDGTSPDEPDVPNAPDTGSAKTGRGGSFNRQLSHYPDTGPRYLYLGIVVLATIVMYYELYITYAVSTSVITHYDMTFTFFVYIGVVGGVVGAFASLIAGLADRWGRANLVVYGLLVVGVLVAFVQPHVGSKWAFLTVFAAVSFVEGIVLVATPALIRDFSPQLGRASAMGYWTMGPVLGSVVVTEVTSHTFSGRTTFQDEIAWAGYAGLVVFLVAVAALRELTPGLRDQLMVSLRDRALIEARAEGLDTEEALSGHWRQMLRLDVIGSAFAISIYLIIYFAAVGFFVVYFATTFGYSEARANSVATWYWVANAIALVVVGLLSDALKVRKPFMVIGAVGSIVMVALFATHATQATTGYYTFAWICAGIGAFTGVTYAPWMASFTETVEKHNPAATATGLAVWGWIIRIVVAASGAAVPLVVTSATPLVDHGPAVSAAVAEAGPATIAAANGLPPDVIAAAKRLSPDVLAAASRLSATPDVLAAASRLTPDVIAAATKAGPALAIVSAHPALFAQLEQYSSPASIPPALLQQAIQQVGLANLQTVQAEASDIQLVLPHEADLLLVQPHEADLKLVQPHEADLQLVQPFATDLQLVQAHATQLAVLQQYGAKVQAAQADNPKQWQRWWWIAAGAQVLFIPFIFVMTGRWSPRKAREDAEAHAKRVDEELATLTGV